MDATVAVIIPARNAAPFIGDALESALTQRPQPNEVLVIDDQSDDDTRTIVSSFAPRVRLLNGPGTGPSAARNVGILNSTASLVAFLDADDIWLPGKLAQQLGRLDETHAGLVFTDFYHGETPTDHGPPRLQEYSMAREGDVFCALLQGNFILTSSVLVRRLVLAQAGLFRSDLRGGEDIELWLRITRLMPFTMVREPLVFKRRHDANITNAADYVTLSADTWKVINFEHRDVCGEARSLIDSGLATRLFESALHSLRAGDVARARHAFAEVPWTRGNALRLMAWRSVSMLPPVALRWLRRVRTRVVGSTQ
jgi:glycosyltransferase involved in cell wall biosynthesis